VHDALRDALVVEVRDLLAQDEILEQRGAALVGAQRVLVVGDRDPLVGRQGRAVSLVELVQLVSRATLVVLGRHGLLP
jgi:hypothetical protein